MPDWKSHVQQQLASLSLDRTLELEISTEICNYLDDFYADARSKGLSEEDAIALTRAQLDSPELLSVEIGRAMAALSATRSALSPARAPEPPAGVAGNLFSDFVHDIRFGLRMLLHKPVFTAVTVFTLALGMGANTAAFSFLNALFLRPLPVPSPERVVRMYAAGQDTAKFDVFSYPNYLDVKNRSLSFTELAAHQQTSANLSTSDQDEIVQGEIVTGNYFLLMGVKPIIGRTLLPEDDQRPGGHPVIVVSYSTWKRRFGGTSDALARKVHINGHPFEIVGVMAPSFRGSYDALASEFWAPLSMQEQIRPRGLPLTLRGWGWLTATGRLKAGVSIAQAQSELERISRQLQQDFPRQNRGLRFELYAASALPEAFQKGAASFLAFLMIAVALVLLVACSNLATMLLARVCARERESAIRQSLGASRGRLARQWLAESFLISLLGGLAGLVVAWWAGQAAQFLAPPGFENFSPAANLDWRVLAFTFAVIVATGLITGLVPAFRVGRTDLVSSLKESGKQVGARHSSRAGGALIVVQVTSSLILLVVAGLLLRSLHESKYFDPGFNSDNVLLKDINLGRHGYNEAQGRAFYRQVTDRLRSLPGVKAVTFALVVPLGFSREHFGYRIEGHQPPAGGPAFSIDTNVIGSDYFTVMGIPLLEGRTIDERDSEPGAKRVVVINETMARKFWPGQSAVGRTFLFGTDGPALEIVGVARDIKYYTLAEDPRPYVYSPFSQVYSSDLTLHVRTTEDPNLMKRSVQDVVRSIDRRVASQGITTLSELRMLPLFFSRVMAIASSLFGLLTLILTAVGLYGLLSYSVSQRTHEIGVRMALGARRLQVFRQVAGRGVLLTLIGVTIGIGAAALAGRAISSQLFGISTADPATFAGASLILIFVSLAACSFPARRATRVDPITALRCE